MFKSIVFLALISLSSISYSQKLPDLGIVLDEIQLDCSEFKPNLITKFLWKEGKTRDLLYKKCIDQNNDDEKFIKYSDLIINDKNIIDLTQDIASAKTRLTIFSLTSSLKNYLDQNNLSNEQIKNIKLAVNKFRTDYKEKRLLLDREIQIMTFKISPRKKEKELINIILESEKELDQNIEKTISYMEFVVSDHKAYVKSHNKFFPHMFKNKKLFYGKKLTSYECQFLKFNFGEEFDDVKFDLNLSCK